MADKTFSANCNVNMNANVGKPTAKPLELARQQAENEWNQYLDTIRQRFIQTRAQTLLIEWEQEKKP